MTMYKLGKGALYLSHDLLSGLCWILYRLHIISLLRKDPWILDVKRLGKMTVSDWCIIFEKILSHQFIQRFIGPPKPLISEKEAYRKPDALNMN